VAELLRRPYARLDLCAEPAAAETEVIRWAQAYARAAEAPLAVLLVLPEDAEREAVSGWLDAAGARTLAAATAAEAAAALDRESPDLLLLDWTEPGGQAEGLSRMVRRSARLCRTPVVALGSLDTDAERERALAAGVNELLIRPVAQGRLVPPGGTRSPGSSPPGCCRTSWRA
jgi:PleD family two-component response regulator